VNENEMLILKEKLKKVKTRFERRE